MGNQQDKDEVTFIKEIGNGSYGKVYKAKWKNKLVAAKQIHEIFFDDYAHRDQNSRHRLFEGLEKEWKILEQLDHPNIVQYFTVIITKNLEQPPIIVTELCETDLEKYVRSVRKTRPQVLFGDIVSIMRDIADGLDYLHSRKPDPIVHRDLASKNILLTGDLRAKIADLGLAKIFPDGTMLATAGIGTPIYAAPETIPRTGARHKTHYTEKVDIFSYGAMMLEVIVGHMPGMLPDAVLEDGEVVPEHIRRSEDIEEMGANHPMRPIVISCFADRPDERPSASNIVTFLRQFNTPTTSLGPSTSAALSVHDVQRVASEHVFDLEVKVAVLGETGVGKTSIIRKFIYPAETTSNLPCTMQPGNYFERLQVRGRTVRLQIVDTPGEKRSAYHLAQSAIPMIYRAAKGAVVVFDVSDRDSYHRVPEWLAMIRDRCEVDIPLILVGNKTDKPKGDWKVKSQEAQNYANSCGLFYIETSATGYENIDEIFSVLIDLLIQREDRQKIGPLVRYVAAINTCSGSLLKNAVSSGYDIAAITERMTTAPWRTPGTVQLVPGQAEIPTEKTKPWWRRC